MISEHFINDIKEVNIDPVVLLFNNRRLIGLYNRIVQET